MEVTLHFDETQCERANFVWATALFEFHDHFVGFDQAQSRECLSRDSIVKRSVAALLQCLREIRVLRRAC